jgi:type II secretion system protein G
MKKLKPLFKIKKVGEGFTLIELLVVIGIIGVLSGVLLANFVGVRQRARDGIRKSDLRQIQSALELYRSDQGVYPTTLYTVCNSSLQNPPANTVTYMQKIPCDPSSTVSTAILYSYSSAGATYTLTACLENQNDSQGDKDTGGNNIHGSCGALWQYTLQNP